MNRWYHWGSKADRKYCTLAQRSFFFLMKLWHCAPKRLFTPTKSNFLGMKDYFPDTNNPHIEKKAFFMVQTSDMNIIKHQLTRVKMSQFKIWFFRTSLSPVSLWPFSSNNTNFTPSFPCFCWPSRAELHVVKRQTERRCEATHGRPTTTAILREAQI